MESDTPRTFDQTELLFHGFTHGCEGVTVGTGRVSEQWASVDRAGARFWKGCQSGEESGETLALLYSQVLDIKRSRTGGEGRN